MNQKPNGFVDLYGTAERLGVDEEEHLGPTWKTCPQGQEQLWKVFWGYGVFGTGVALAASLAILFIATQIALILATEEAAQAAPGIWIGIAAGLAIFVPYTLWLWVSLWRCAPNCQTRFWGHLVRCGVVLQAIGVVWGLTVFVEKLIA